MICAAAALGAGVTAGSAVALWSDTSEVAGDVVTGLVAFSAGRSAGPSAAATAPGDDVTVTIGAAEAQALVDHGVVAVPITVSALAQGNLGLRYAITMPNPPAGTILDAADLTIFRVATTGECTTTAVPPGTAPDLTSAPDPATYSDTTTPTDEHWCLYGTLAEPPLAGTYTNTGTVTAQSELGEVTDTDTWDADIQADPASEPDADLIFSHLTFRPGASLDYLTEDFAIESSQWTYWGTGVVVSGGRLAISLTTTYPALTSSDVYNLTSSSVCVRADPSTAHAYDETFMALGSGPEWWTAGQDKLLMARNGGNLLLRSTLDGVDSDVSVAYDATGHAWWRIREDTGTVYWEASADGVAWTTLRSEPVSFPISFLKLHFYAGNWQTDAGGVSYFDDVNRCGAA